MITINVEQDVRRQYNRRVLFCIRIRSVRFDFWSESNFRRLIFSGAALIIGLWDLFIHSTALFALILMFSRAPPIEKYLEQIPSPTNLIDSPTNLVDNPTRFLVRTKMERANSTRPTTNIDAGHFYMNLDLMTLKWIRSLRERLFRNSTKNISFDCFPFAFRRSIRRFCSHCFCHNFYLSLSLGNFNGEFNSFSLNFDEKFDRSF